MTDYAIDDSEYQRLQRENERLKAENAKLEAQFNQFYDNAHNNHILIRNAWHELKAERDLAVRVAGILLDNIKAGDISEKFPDHYTYLLFESDGVLVLGDIRKVLAWYREAQDAANDDGAR